MKSLGIIPARGGSKGIKNKNLVEVGGKSLLQWTIDAAMASKLDSVVVSTECQEIASAAAKLGVQTIHRPRVIATDEAPPSRSCDIAKHAIWSHGGRYDLLVYLQPTSPMRTADDIDKVLGLFVGVPGSRFYDDPLRNSVITVTQDENTHSSRIVEVMAVGR